MAGGRGLLFNVVIGWNRIRGEIHNVRLLDAQVRGNFPGLLSEAQAAQNRYYEYNNVALPLSWYEGISYYQMGQGKRAVDAFERAYTLNPWSFQVLNNYASALVKENRYGEAVPLFEKAMEINPRFENGKFNLSYACYHLGDYAKALEWLSRVDTMENPQTAQDKLQNAQVIKQQAEFRKVIEAKMK
ncbi:MAG: tetratricopeptide repeat protein [Lewinellaceae bacterium]|nr:tetratricopeptide repeat protein [Lewinellaceae bacterium]